MIPFPAPKYKHKFGEIAFAAAPIVVWILAFHAAFWYDTGVSEMEEGT